MEHAENHFQEHLNDLNKASSDPPSQISSAETWRMKLMDSVKGFTDDASNSSDTKLLQEAYHTMQALRQKFRSSPIVPSCGKPLHPNTSVRMQKRLYQTKKAPKQKENNFKPTSEEAAEICSNYLAELNS